MLVILPEKDKKSWLNGNLDNSDHVGETSDQLLYESDQLQCESDQLQCESDHEFM